MTVRVGFIGAGGIANDHIKALKKLANVEIVSIFDMNKDATAKFVEATGAREVADADQLLNRKEIDAVFICIPQFAREDLEEIAAHRGIHLLVEKPLGLDLELVRRKEQVIRETGVINSAGYLMRYYDTVLKAKRYLDGKQPHLIQVNRFGGSHPAKWWRTLDMSGGNLVDAVTHQVHS
jgi:myo-inositol 2-dehydrogenase/D-chiro-inositol 1-dehydrogenase